MTKVGACRKPSQGCSDDLRAVQYGLFLCVWLFVLYVEQSEEEEHHRGMACDIILPAQFAVGSSAEIAQSIEPASHLLTREPAGAWKDMRDRGIEHDIARDAFSALSFHSPISHKQLPARTGFGLRSGAHSNAPSYNVHLRLRAGSNAILPS